MADDIIGIEFGVTDDSMTRLRNAAGEFRRFDETALLETQAAVDHIAIELESFIRAEFEPHNDTGYTLDETLKVETHGFDATITMGGGGPFIEYGTTAHWVGPVNAQALHWAVGGEDFFSTGHEVSGIEADDFIGRSIEDVDLERELERIAYGTYTHLFSEGEYAIPPDLRKG